jgi:histidinol-phosphate/aromatic aminotransferase/cobyric acid decarboxylase-like protein
VELLAHHGFDVHAADAPWVLVPAAGDLRERLAPRGILVRDCASFGLAGTVRIAVPGEAGLARLRSALD